MKFKANAEILLSIKLKNQEINSDQYLREVYYELSDELARDQVEYVFSKASDLYDLEKDELAKLEQLKTALSKQKQELEEIKKREKS